MYLGLINDKFLVDLIESYKPTLQKKFYIVRVHDNTGPERSYNEGLYRTLDEAAKNGVAEYHSYISYSSSDEEPDENLSDEEKNNERIKELKENLKYPDNNYMFWIEIDEVYLH